MCARVCVCVCARVCVCVCVEGVCVCACEGVNTLMQIVHVSVFVHQHWCVFKLLCVFMLIPVHVYALITV